MSDLTLRILLASGALLVAAVITAFLRLRTSAPVRALSPGPLSSGIYLFSSSACLDCSAARNALVRRLGEAGFREMKWEDEPEIFHELGIVAVPSTMVVPESGSAQLWSGTPDEMFSSLDP